MSKTITSFFSAQRCIGIFYAIVPFLFILLGTLSNWLPQPIDEISGDLLPRQPFWVTMFLLATHPFILVFLPLVLGGLWLASEKLCWGSVLLCTLGIACASFFHIVSTFAMSMGEEALPPYIVLESDQLLQIWLWGPPAFLASLLVIASAKEKWLTLAALPWAVLFFVAARS